MTESGAVNVGCGGQQHVEPYGGTGVDPRRAPESHRIARLFESLAAEDKLLTKHNLRRDQIVDELIALGATF